MTGEKVDLKNMLECRERRARIQKNFIEIYKSPVISFCMNIPGPVKTNHKIKKVFEFGKEILFKNLNALKIKINEKIEFHEATGDELILSLDAPAEILKNIALKIEDDKNFPAARLFDMDVININGEKLSRPEPRKCLICGKPAQNCARSRAHSVKEMQDAIEKLLY